MFDSVELSQTFSPPAFTLRQLQYAVAVADTLSFRRAAQLCFVSQPSLSAQLAQLEDVLGIVLFERTRKKVLLTQRGAAIVERARQLVLSAGDLAAAAKSTSDPLAGRLRIGVIPTISPYLLPRIVPKLRSRFARLQIEWCEDRTERLMGALSRGELEGALVALEADLGTVEHAVIAKDPFVLAVHRKHPLARKKSPVTALELHAADIMLLDDGHCFREQALEVCNTAHAREGQFRATSLTTLVQMVAGGAGVTLLPALAVATEAKRAQLRIRAVAMPSAHRTVALVWREGAPIAPALREIATVMRQGFPIPRVSVRRR